ncbi:reverse transcriptase-rnase h-integrase, partial [Moniliophthora roreri MCA 2997]
QRGAVKSLQQERTEPEAKSSKPDPFDEYRNLFHTLTPEMTTPAGSAAALDIKPKVELDDTNEQWVRTISTAILQTIDDKKDEASKGPTLDPFLGKQSDTCRFLLDLELYFAMNPVKANTDEKKKMLLLSLVKGSTSEWKQRETMKLFPEDDDPEEKKKAAEETWSSFKQRFQNEWQPVNVVREAQAKIKQIKMTDRADEYVNRFCLIAMDTKGKEDSDKVQINAKLSTSQVLAQAHEVKAKLLEELLPPYLSDYSDRFEKKKAERFPPSRPYDHAIDLKPDFKPRDCKIYSLSQKEWIEQDKFLDENLRKGYIRPSKSPMASPFFFVAKKEAGALRPCQDY